MPFVQRAILKLCQADALWIKQNFIEPWFGLITLDSEFLESYCARLVNIHLDHSCDLSKTEDTNLISIADIKCFLQVLDSMI